MPASPEFVLGLLDEADPARAAYDDFRGPHGPALRAWQRRGFLASAPEPNPVPSCPRRREGVPVAAGGRLLCGLCLSTVDRGHLGLWRFDLDRLLAWLARALGLEGGVRPIDGPALAARAPPGRGPPVRVLLPPRRAAVGRRPGPPAGVPGRPPAAPPGGAGRRRGVRRAGAVAPGRPPAGRAVPARHRAGRAPPRPRGRALRRGERGPVGRRRVARRGARRQQGVPPPGLFGGAPRPVRRLRDLKHEVLGRSGSRDATEEATFCQKLEGRIKARWVAEIDRLIATTNKGDGYRLRGLVER
jgi:hypothetical protein